MIKTPKCQNPECGKKVPKQKKYCDENCLRRHIELKKVHRLESEEDLWLGQERRKRATDTILRLARELLPMPHKRFACIVSYRTGLSYRKVTDDYLEVLLGIGYLRRNENLLTLGDGI